MNADLDRQAWRRATRHDRCPACDGGSWCTFTQDRSVARCKRNESPKPCHGDDGQAWLHVFTNEPRTFAPRPRRIPVRTPPQDLGPLAERWRRDLSSSRLLALSDQLGIDPIALQAIGAGWNGRAFSFPMFDQNNTVVGIRLRCPSTGAKWSVAGGREGVFRRVLGEPSSAGPVVVVEGATDTGAAVQLDYAVLGRPSCCGAIKITAHVVKGCDVVLLPDADAPGRRGAEALAVAILPYVTSLRVVELPAKDLREFVRAGGTRDELLQLIDAAPVRRLRTRFSHV